MSKEEVEEVEVEEAVEVCYRCLNTADLFRNYYTIYISCLLVLSRVQLGHFFIVSLQSMGWRPVW